MLYASGFRISALGLEGFRFLDCIFLRFRTSDVGLQDFGCGVSCLGQIFGGLRGWEGAA